MLLHFRTHDNAVSSAGDFRWFDKVPLKHADYDLERFRADGARIVPGAVVRMGAHVARDVVLMPSFVNVGAYVGEGSMVDTWATVGSCAQVGRNVHLSGGVGIGGVLEPLQARPTIIEDDCFIGARSEVVEGVIVERGAVLSMGVFIGASTRIYDRETREVTYGRVPAGSVVVPGSSAGFRRLAFARLAPSSSRKSTRRLARRPRSTSCCGRSRRRAPSPAGLPSLRRNLSLARVSRRLAAHRHARPCARRARGGGVSPSGRVKFRRSERDTPPDPVRADRARQSTTR